MGANNQGIDHIAFKDGGMPLCKNRNAHMSVAFARWQERPAWRFCKRCEVKALKAEAISAKRAARS